VSGVHTLTGEHTRFCLWTLYLFASTCRCPCWDGSAADAVQATAAADVDALVSTGDPPERLLAAVDGCGRSYE
jgi:hypothetical protein